MRYQIQNARVFLSKKVCTRGLFLRKLYILIYLAAVNSEKCERTFRYFANCISSLKISISERKFQNLTQELYILSYIDFLKLSKLSEILSQNEILIAL